MVSKEGLKNVQIPQGALLHCQILQPVSSEHLGPVQVRLTRSVVIRGQTQLEYGAILAGRIKEFRAGRFFFEQEWNGRNGEGAVVSIMAVSQQNDYSVSLGQFGRQDGQVGIPGRPIKEPVESKGGEGLLGNILRASGELAKDRAQSALGEYLPYNARNIILEGAANSLDSHLDRFKESVDKGQEEFVIAAGAEFYLLAVKSRTDGELRSGPRLSTDSLRELIRQSK